MSAVHLLIGHASGKGAASKARESVMATIRAEGHEPIDITAPTASGSRDAAAAAVAGGASRLLVVGGDGMVHLAAAAVAGSKTILGIVPIGTGNDFARGITSIPDDAVAATRVALGDARPLDAIRTEAGWVASVATAGFSGDVNQRANSMRFPRGSSRYTLATLAELPTLRARHVKLTVDGVTSEYDSVLLAVANTGWFGGGMHISPEAEPDDGILDVTVVGDVGRLELLRFFRLVFSGRHTTHPAVHTLRGRRVIIEADDLALWGDGEAIGTTPATFEAVPGALRVAR